MSQLLHWFETVPTRQEAKGLIWRILALNMLLTIAYMSFVFFSGDLAKIIEDINKMMRDAATLPPEIIPDDWYVRDLLLPLLVYILTAGIVAPVVEELIFRLVPLGIAILAFRWSRWTKPLILIAAVAVGIVFGLAHIWNENATLASVLVVQGVLGICFGILFAKMSGLQMKGLWRAYKTTMRIHMLWNLIAVPIVALAFGLIFAAFIGPYIEIPPELAR